MTKRNKTLFKPAFIFLLLIAYFLSFSFSAPIFAQEPDYDRINDIAKNLNCPTCAGINLSDCRTLTCEQWRNQINDLVAQGYSNEQVLDYFATRYGTQVLLEPPKAGSTLLLWILPGLVLLAGAIWLTVALRRWAKPKPALSRSTPPGAATTTSSSPAGQYLNLVEKDLHLGE